MTKFNVISMLSRFTHHLPLSFCDAFPAIILRSTRARKSRFGQPALEALEARMLLSVITVINTLDSGTGSLRWAIDEANLNAGVDSISFDPTIFSRPQTITVTTGSLTFADTARTSFFQPASRVTVRGDNLHSVIVVNANAIAFIDGLTITGGRAAQGGGVFVRGNLTMTNCLVDTNVGTGSGGGGIFVNNGVLNLSRSTISNNVTGKCGGGIFVDFTSSATLTDCTISGNSQTDLNFGYGGGVYSQGTTNITKCTVSGNRAARFGGGIYAGYGTTRLTNVTVSGNSAQKGGGVMSFQATNFLTNVTITGNSNTATGSHAGLRSQTNSSVTLTNTIVAGNRDPNGASDVGGSSISGSFNLIGTGGAAGMVNGVNGNLVGVVQPLLAPLGDYGGSTKTIALLPGSLAIDSGKNTGAPATDQRGKGRAGSTDIGAFESQGFTLNAVAGSTPQTTVVRTAFANPLAVTVNANNVVEPVNGGVINLTVPINDASATLSSLSSPIAANRASVTARANGLIGSYRVTATTRGAAAFTFALTNIAKLDLGGLGRVVTYIQGGSPIAVAPTITLGASNRQNIASATILFSNVQIGDRFSFYNQFALQNRFVEDTVNQTATLTLTGESTAANYQTTFASILFGNVAGIPSTSARVATFTVTDVLNNSANGTQTINLLRVSQQPKLINLETTSMDYIANYPSVPAQPISATLVATDADSDNLTGATVQIAVGYQNDANGKDLLGFTNQLGITGLFDAATGKLTLSGVSSISNYRTALRSVTFSTLGLGTIGSLRTLSMTAYDDSSPTPLASDPVTRNVSLTLSVAPPTLSGFGITTRFIQFGNPVPIVSSLIVTQPSGLNLSSATVKLTNLEPGDRFEFHNSFALQHSFVLSGDEKTATLTITGHSSAANYQTTLRSLIFWNVSGLLTFSSRTATFTVFAPTGQSGIGSQNFSMAYRNEPPVLFGIESPPLVYSANHPEFPAQPISNTIEVTDQSSKYVSRATVQLTAGYQNDVNGHDLLSFLGWVGITSTFDASTGTLTLAGLSTVAHYHFVLRRVLFSSSGSAISTATRTLSITVYDDTVPAALVSNTVTRDVNVITTNTSPQLSGLAATANYVQGAPRLLIAPNLQITDVDSNKLFGATITFSNWQGDDRLDFLNQFALSQIFTQDLVAHTASLVLRGASSVANYKSQLQSIRYYCVGGNPMLSARTIRISVNDGFTDSNIVTGEITVSI
jgi:hypothetical protein